MRIAKNIFKVLLPLAVAPLFLGLSSCAFKKDAAKATDEKQGPIVQQQGEGFDVIASSEVLYEFIPLEINQYIARLSWPKGRNLKFNLRYAINRAIDSEQAVSEAIDAKQISHFDIPCSSRTVVSVEITYSIGDSSLPREISKKIVCPRDYDLISEDSASAGFNPQEITGRLFMRKGSTLFIENKKVMLNLIGLHIDERATIQVYSNIDKLEAGDGKAELKIKARFAEGQLNLKLRGADSLNGLAGDDRLEGRAEHLKQLEESPVKPGANGSDGKEEEQCGAGRAMRGVNAAPVCKKVCTVQPTDGQDGESAKIAGRDGLPGGDGYATPKAFIDIAEADHFSLVVTMQPGAPGQGGKPGAGQKGAAGGLAGKKPESCKAAKNGKSGGDAPPGNPGSAGKPGACGTLTVSQNLKEAVRTTGEGLYGNECVKDDKLIQVLK